MTEKKRAAETMLLEERGGDRGVADTAVVEGEHDGLVRNRLLDNPGGIIGRCRLHPPESGPSKERRTHHPHSQSLQHGYCLSFDVVSSMALPQASAETAPG